MADLGFWSIAREEPEKLAVVDPDEREVRAGELLASCNQVVHGLRAAGLEQGEAVAMVLPNSVEVFELYLAALQAGFYLVPINFHLVGTEIAYIVQDSEAKAFVAHERFADECAAAAEEIGFPKDQRFALADTPGSLPVGEAKAGAAATLPWERPPGRGLDLPPRAAGKPEGGRPPPPGRGPEAGAVGFSGMLFLFRLQPHDDNVHICGSPLYHTA